MAKNYWFVLVEVVDSVVLLSLINKMNYTIGVAHCNFKLRHKESDDDSFFVENLCNN